MSLRACRIDLCAFLIPFVYRSHRQSALEVAEAPETLTALEETCCQKHVRGTHDAFPVMSAQGDEAPGGSAGSSTASTLPALERVDAFINSQGKRRRWLLCLLGAGMGFSLTALWYAEFRKWTPLAAAVGVRTVAATDSYGPARCTEP